MPAEKKPEAISHEQLVDMHKDLHEAHKKLQAAHEALKRDHATHQERIAALEKHAHTDHTIGQEAMDQIAAHAVHHVNEHMRKVFGHSGLPVSGEQ